jgi:hypothetical protein
VKITHDDIIKAIKLIEQWEATAKRRKNEKARADCRLIAEVIRALSGR